MDDKVFEAYLKAGKAVAKALELGRKITRPGTKYEDIAKLCEGEILNSGCGLAFPINMSLDRVAAHYSPVIDDKSVIPEHGLIKLDCGAHFDGYIADAAITVNIGEDKGIYKDLIDAAEDALKVALANVKPGTDVVTIGALIERTMKKYNVKPISNLGGHGLEKYNLHAGIFIPNDHTAGQHYLLEENRAYAIEPFSTNGVGRIRNSPQITIYHMGHTKKKNLKLDDKFLLQKFKDKFGNLPFSPRHIDFLRDKKEIETTIQRFMKKGYIWGYNVFVEVGNGLVAQKEHTFIVTKDGAHVTTLLDNGL